MPGTLKTKSAPIHLALITYISTKKMAIADQSRAVNLMMVQTTCNMTSSKMNRIVRSYACNTARENARDLSLETLKTTRIRTFAKSGLLQLKAMVMVMATRDAQSYMTMQLISKILS